MSDTLDDCLEICKLINASPRRDATFSTLKEEMEKVGTGLRNLCLKRRIVNAASLLSLRENYDVLNATWHEASDMQTSLKRKQG